MVVATGYAALFTPQSRPRIPAPHLPCRLACHAAAEAADLIAEAASQLVPAISEDGHRRRGLLRPWHGTWQAVAHLPVCIMAPRITDALQAPLRCGLGLSSGPSNIPLVKVALHPRHEVGCGVIVALTIGHRSGRGGLLLSPISMIFFFGIFYFLN